MNRPDVIVIGAGLAGLSSALFLSRAGLTVMVLEKEADVGMATSFANAGMLTPSMSDPWNAPGAAWKLLRWLGRADAPMRLRLGALHHYLGWGLSFLRNASPARHRAAMLANFRLSNYSVAQTRALRGELKLSYSAGTKGTMKVFRDRRQFEQVQALYNPLREEGLSFEAVDGAGAARIEPLLAETASRIAGALYFPQDETGNAHLFCRELHARLVERGVGFEFGAPVEEILVDGERVAGVRAGTRHFESARVVLAAGAWSRQLALPLRLTLNIRPVKGYSVSVEVTDPALMPTLSLIDDHLHAAATPLGSTLRLAGTAEFGGWRSELDPLRIKALWDFLAALSPTLARHVARQTAREWAGFRPMAADGRPYISATPICGLYLNTGHGHLGWTQAAGSAALLSQLVTGRTTDIDPAPYALTRG